MLTVQGNIWKYWNNEPNSWIGVTTNGVVKDNGELVMGKGIALEAADLYPFLPTRLGEFVKRMGNIPCFMKDLRVVTIPTKHDWKSNSDLKLIDGSIKLMHQSFKNMRNMEPDTWGQIVFIPAPGCGNGGLTLEQVQPILEKHLDDQFVLVLQP